jgi:diguanylate cyclase (GGDEF)-like protein/PAS domain S-box-containing protein
MTDSKEGKQAISQTQETIVNDIHDVQAQALQALHEGRFDLAEQILNNSEVSLSELIENLRIYQAELLIQNEELQRSQSELNEALMRFTSFFMTLPVAELVVDRQGLIIDANPQAEQLFGLKPTHLHQHFFVRLVDDQDRARLLQTWNRLEENHAIVIDELHFHNRNQRLFIGDLHIARLQSDSTDRRRFVCAVLDRTEAVRQREALHTAHMELRESEERYRVLAEFSPDWEYWLGTNHQFIYISPACEDITGHSPQDFMDDPHLIERLLHPQDRERCINHFHELEMEQQEPKEHFMEFRIINKQGELRWIEHVCKPVISAQGHYLGKRGVNRDITKRRLAELELQRSEDLLRATGRLARVGGWELDVKAHQLRWTEMTCLIYGVEPNTTLTLTQSLSFFDSVDRTVLHEALTQAIEKATPFQLQLQLHNTRGELLWVKIAGKAALTEQKDVAYVRGSIQDVTAQVEADNALRESEYHYRTLFESAGQGMALLSDGRFISLNQTALRMFGYDSDQPLLGLTPGDLSPPIQPDGMASQEKAHQMMALAFERGVQHFEWEHVRQDGSLFPVAINLVRIELHGAPALFVSLRDLSHEQTLREREIRAQTVFENTAEGIIVTDAEQRIIAVNPAFTEITGYTEAEVLGQTPRLLQSKRHNQAFYQAIWAMLEKTGQWRGEFWNRRRNGEIYPQQSTISAVYNQKGQVVNYIGVFGDMTRLKHSEEELYRLEHYDALTGLPNRVLLRANLEQAIKRARRTQTLLGLLYLDLDLFKTVNDTLGHPVGDQLLQQVAKLMRQQIREVNNMARVGGDEFVIVVEDVPEPNTMAKLAYRLLNMFMKPIIADGHELYVTASLGISLYPLDGRNMDELLSHADVAMYQAKEHGRNTYRFFEPAMTAGATERLKLEMALRGALARGELFLHYQAQVNLADETLNGVETLLRWHHPVLGAISPVTFIPIAEEIGLIRELGAWVLEQALQQLAAWDRAGFYVPRLAVNLSVQQIESPDLIGQVQHILQRVAIHPERLELEVTESMLMRHVEQSIQNLYKLRDLGITLAIDDFGSGYSSLRYLKELPIHRLKIDRSFIQDVTENNNDGAIVRAVIALGHSLGLMILAEGVETSAQAQFLKAEQCHEAQGYLFGRPISAADWLAQHQA